MITPIFCSESLKIGIVDFVSPDEIKVVLDLDAPNDVALNAGAPRPFPRVNSYVLIPGESGFLVAQIEWITIERSQFPKRRGMQDFGILDLPYPMRKMSLNPVGILKESISKDPKIVTYKFLRGIEIFPTVGDPVLIPSQVQLKAIVESGDNRRVDIGISPLAGNAIVSIDPDRLFGRHLAVLGNTGSGKSCSVAGLIRWSIEAASKHASKKANTRFIILDPNGEYSSTFKDFKNIKVFGAEKKDGVEQLEVPVWLWNSSEWVAFAQAAGRAQKPTLIQALRAVRDVDFDLSVSESTAMKQYLRTLIDISIVAKKTGDPWGKFPQNKNFYEKIQRWRSGVEQSDSFSDNQNKCLEEVCNHFDKLIQARSEKFPTYDFTRSEIETLIFLLKNAYESFGGQVSDVLPLDADTPIPFSSDNFIRSLEANAELMGTSEHVETMIMRVKSLLSDLKLKPIIMPDRDVADESLVQWLNTYVDCSDCCVTVIDLSLLPAEITHIVTAVFARILLEALQRFRKINNGKTLPTVLIMEEAHTFIKRYSDDSDNENAVSMCSRVFEKIAREGRKYGLGLVLSSQRPSELSPTVLSQCNSFLLHRLSNDKDQELVSRLVPDNLRGLLRELPSLPPRNAILLGWASELPMLVQMKYLDEKCRPKSDDPNYWSNWTSHDVDSNWREIAADWQGKKEEKSEEENAQ